VAIDATIAEFVPEECGQVFVRKEAEMGDGKAEDQLIVHVAGESEIERGLMREMLEKAGGTEIKVTEVGGARNDSSVDPDLLCVIFGEEPAFGLSCLERARRESSRVALAAFHREWPPVLARQAIRVGAHELLKLPVDPDELALLVLKLRERRNAPSRRDRLAEVYAVLGLGGGAGVTTVSANLALALRYKLGQRAAIVDLDLQNGGIEAALNLEPAVVPLSLIGSQARLDSIKLEAGLSKHPSGIYVLTGATKIEDADLVSDLAIGAVIDLMRQLFDTVIIDCGPRINEHAVAAWERATELLYVIDSTLWSARRMPRFMEFFRSLGMPALMPRLIVNRFTDGEGASLKELAQAAQTPVYATIPNEPGVLRRVQIASGDLWRTTPGSRLARAFERLAHQIQAPGEAVIESSRFVNWLRSAWNG
jgi:pilus assembly protein CpaE